MKILIINPNSDENTDNCIRQKAQAFVDGACQVEVKHIASAPKLIASYEHMAGELPEMLQIIREEKEYDAFIIACHSDPNLDVLKEVSDRPVVGIAEASMKIASMYCNGFAILSPSVKSIPKKWTLAEKYHCGTLYRGAAVCEGDDEESVYRAACEAVDRYHVDGIVLGCANYALADSYVEEKLGIPVFEGVACALMIAMGMVSYERYKRKK